MATYFEGQYVDDIGSSCVGSIIKLTKVTTYFALLVILLGVFN